MSLSNFLKAESKKFFTKPAQDILNILFIKNQESKKYFKSDYELILNDMKNNSNKYLKIVQSQQKFNLTDLKKMNDKIKETTPNIKYIYDDKNKQITRVNVNDNNDTNILKGLIKQWGIKRNINNVMNNIKIKKDYIYKNLISSNNTEILDDKEVNLYVKATYYINYNNMQKENTFIYSNNLSIKDKKKIDTDGKIKNFYDYLVEKNYNYLLPFPMLTIDDIINMKIYEEYNFDDTSKVFCVVDIKDLTTNTTFYISTEDQRLRENKFYSICNLYNEVIELKPTLNNCVKEYLKNNTEISHKKIDKLGNLDGVSANEIYNLSKDYNLKCVLYDIDGKIIKANYPKKKTKTKNIIGICYNNHFYPLKNETLKKISLPKENIIKSNEDINNEFNNLVKNYILPSNIHLNKKLKIGSYTHNNINYISNDDYNLCISILEKFGLSDKMTPATTITNISDIIEKLYIKDNINSFLPIDFIKSAYTYYNNDIEHEKYIKDYITIDKNKFYSYLLKELEYLIKVDYRQTNIKTFDKDNQPKEIIEKYLYIVKPEYSTILLQNTNIYSGKHLKYCKNEGLKFEILEEMETITTPNYYKNFIIDLYNKIDHKIAKDIINMMIGRFQKNPQIKEKYKVIKISNKDERAGDLETNYIKYNDELFFKYEKEQKFMNLYNKKPIAVQIKDASAIELYEKIKSLNLKNDELISIETDSITFINTGQYEKIKNDLDEKDIDKWKEIKKDINYFIKHLGYENSTYDNKISFNDVLYKNNNNNILFDCYAGAGKSHRIKNEIIPKLKNYEYIILTPQHSVNKPYKKMGLNCAVIQTYFFNNKIPFEKYIIVDEIGLFNKQANDFLYKCMMSNKIIYSLGDFKQLLPIFENSHFNKDYYLKFMYSKIYNLNTNYRNNFKNDYYDKLMNEKIDLINEVKKNSITDYKKADVIICITNNEVEKYNKLMMTYLNKKFDDIGAKIICKTNKLKHKNIYNNDDFIILEYDKQSNNYKIDDDLYITKEELNKNFSPNYAITLYKAQGQEFNNFFFPETSYIFLNGRSTYTLISRLKQDLTIETLENNKNILSKINITY